MTPSNFDLDLGDSHWLCWFAWKPDRRLNPQYANLADVDRFGAIVMHATDKTETGLCEGSIEFQGDIQLVVDQIATERAAMRGDVYKPHPKWTVLSWDPLELAPSLLCSCGDHGFIRNGKWVRA